MSESKVYMFPENGNNCGGMMSMIAPLLQLRGIDPGLLALMKNGNGFGGEGGWFIWVIFLFFLMGWGGNGWGNQGRSNQDLGNLISNDTGREYLMLAIQGNANSINQLATTLNCSVGDITQAINGVMSQVQNVGNQVGMSGQLVINAVQQGNMSIAQQLCSCCCDIRESVTKMGYENQLATANQTANLTSAINHVGASLERGFSDSNYLTQAQTCAIQNSIRDISTANTNAIVSKLDLMQTTALQDKIDALREKASEQAVIINNTQQSALFGLMIALATTPINAALTGLTKEVADIQCKLPNTVTLPYSCATAIPTALAYSGLYNNLYNNTGYFG